MQTKLNIAIAGCGIAGLAAAALLAQQGHNIHLYDQFDQPEPVGSGLVIQPVGQVVMQVAGALPEALAHGNKIKHLTGHTSPANKLVLKAGYGDGFGLAIHRASLFAALFRAAEQAGVTVIPNARIRATRLAGNGRHLHTQSGENEDPFDLIIDATGAHSPLSPIVNQPLPFGALWATVDWPQDSPLPMNALSQKYRGSAIMAGVLPIGRLLDGPGSKAAIFWSLRHSDLPNWQQTPLDHWRDSVHRLWPEFAPFINQVGQHSDFTMARYSHGTLTNPVSSRLVHIGDAAHTASPQLGQGANMALLDAFALASAIAARADLVNALETYRMARRNHIRTYQAISRLFTPLYQSDSRVLPILRDHVLAPISGLGPMQKLLSRLVSGDLVPPVQAGLRWPGSGGSGV